MPTRAGVLLLVLFLWSGPVVHSSIADTFGSGANSFEIEFVTIGNPGNPPDTTDRPVTDGAVPYIYRIGKYEISEQMIDKANTLGGLGITTDTRGPEKPATSVSWFEAARFVNWLNTSSGSTPAYKFDNAGNFQLWQPTDSGYNEANLYRNSLAKYFLPSLDEWHKAAYYDPVSGNYYDYPTGSDSVPDGIDLVGDANFEAVFLDGANQLGPNDITNVGVLSPYATVGQGGNVREWLEIAFDRRNTMADKQRMMRGGAWGDIHTLLLAHNDGIGWVPSFQGNFVGLRVVSIIPEPSTAVLFAIAVLQMVCSMKGGRL
jgi:formylglycine-generating enzyme required for sulfatase activity